MRCRRGGQRVVKSGSMWWREVRPCFYRPILPFIPAPAGPVQPPLRSALGGCQYVPSDGGDPPNSSLAYLAFLDAQEYRLANHRARRRAEVRKAAELFRLGRFATSVEFKAHAHPVYLEFHRRTHYAYLSGRVKKARFDSWADAEFADPGLIALGAWSGDSLAAVSLSRVVGDAWVYSSFFATDEALRRNAASLLLNEVRTLASTVEGVKFVFLSMLKPSEKRGGIEAFFLERGAQVVVKPAMLQLNPMSRWVLGRLRPDILRQLLGDGQLRTQSSGSHGIGADEAE